MTTLEAKYQRRAEEAFAKRDLAQMPDADLFAALHATLDALEANMLHCVSALDMHAAPRPVAARAEGEHP